MNIKQDAVALPKYKCHKIVGALKISSVVPLNDEDGLVGLRFCDKGYASCTFVLPARHRPEAGGYFVRYADGYESYSPAHAFELEYHRVGDPEPLELSPIDSRFLADALIRAEALHQAKQRAGISRVLGAIRQRWRDYREWRRKSLWC